MRSVGRARDSTPSCVSCLIGKVLARLSWSNLAGSSVSFCSRAKKASIPSVSCSSFGGGSGGGGGIAANGPAPNLGREGRPELPLENIDPLDALDVIEILESTPVLLLLELP